METTLKVKIETKDRILSLDLSDKSKTFDMIINDLVTFYQKNTKDFKKDYKEYKKDYEKWKKSFVRNEKDYDKWKKRWNKSFERSEKDWANHRKELGKYNKRKQTFEKLLKWAKSKGFKNKS